MLNPDPYRRFQDVKLARENKGFYLNQLHYLHSSISILHSEGIIERDTYNGMTQAVLDLWVLYDIHYGLNEMEDK